MKRCKGCGLVKPLAKFNKHVGGRDGVRAQCSECTAAANRRYRAAIPEELRREIAHEHYRKKANKAGVTLRPADPVELRLRRLASLSKYRLTHPDAGNGWRADNKDRVRAAKQRHKRKYPEKVRASSMKRIAAKRRASPPWANEEKMLAIYREATRLTKETGIQHDVDHIVPLQGRDVCGPALGRKSSNIGQGGEPSKREQEPLRGSSMILAPLRPSKTGPA